MESKIDELSLDECLRILADEKDEILSHDTPNVNKLLKNIDKLIETTKSLEGSSLDDVVLMGSLVDLSLESSEGIEYETYYLGYDLAVDTITIHSPLGSAIYGRKVLETVPYEVLGNEKQVTILSKNIGVEKFPEDIELCNTFGDVVKSKKKN